MSTSRANFKFSTLLCMMDFSIIWTCIAVFWMIGYSTALPNFAGPTRAEQTGNTTSKSPPDKTLLPALHWDHPHEDLRNLVPSKDSKLYYCHEGAADPFVEHIFAKVESTLQRDTVFLLHSSLIDKVSCDRSHQNILVTFAGAESFSHAASSWAPRSEFVVATYTKSCGTPQGQHSFWLIRDVTVETTKNSIICHVERELYLREVLGEVDLVWGTYHPPAHDRTSSGGDEEERFPGANFGETGDSNFDVLLDQTAGYFDFYGADRQKQLGRFFPQIDFDPSSETFPKRAAFSKRADPWNPYQAVVSAISTMSQPSVKDSGSAGASVITNPQSVRALSNAFTLWSPSLSKTFGVNLGPPRDADTVWGRQTLLYARPNIAIFCVNCGVIGTVTVEGRAKIGFFSLQALNLKISANIAAGLNLGMIANVVYSDSYARNLAIYAIPGLGVSIEGLVYIGATISLDAQVSFKFSATGAALVGASLYWPNFVAQLDVVDPSKSGITGDSPSVYKTLQAAGNINADATISLPLTLALGVQIPVLNNYKNGISLVERPGFHAAVAYGGGCRGYSYSADIVNDVLFNILNFKTFNLNHLKYTLFSGCQPSRRSLPVDPLHHRNADLLPRAIVTQGISSSVGDGSVSTSFPRSSGNSSPPPVTSSVPTPTGNPSSSTLASPTGSYSPVTIANEEDPNFNPANTGTDVYNGPVGNVDQDPNNPEIQYVINKAHSIASQATTVEGVAFNSIIVGVNRTYQVLVADDGNLYPTSPNTGSANGTGLFGVYNGVAAINYQGLILHYYADTMQQYNASRIRATDINDTASTSRFVGLKSMPYAGGAEMIFAVDTTSNAYYMTLCNYSNNQTSKIFIVANAQGVRNLQDPSLQNTVTGGPISACAPVALVFSQVTASSASPSQSAGQSAVPSPASPANPM